MCVSHHKFLNDLMCVGFGKTSTVKKYGKLKWSSNSGHSSKIEIIFLEEVHSDYKSEEEVSERV